MSATDSEGLGQKVLDLRTAGKSFGSIAATVGVERKVDALQLFLNAIETRPAEEQVALRAAENARLDALEQRLREHTDAETRDRGLASVVKLRDYIEGKRSKKP